MKKIAFTIPEDLDERFREYVKKEFKGIKGAISIAGIKALENYLNEYERAHNN
jgi:hypothetical protein